MSKRRKGKTPSGGKDRAAAWLRAMNQPPDDEQDEPARPSPPAEETHHLPSGSSGGEPPHPVKRLADAMSCVCQAALAFRDNATVLRTSHGAHIDVGEEAYDRYDRARDALRQAVAAALAAVSPAEHYAKLAADQRTEKHLDGLRTLLRRFRANVNAHAESFAQGPDFQAMLEAIFERQLSLRDILDEAGGVADAAQEAAEAGSADEGGGPATAPAAADGEGLVASVKDRFTFAPGQAMFDGKDLGLPAGLAVDVLKKLVESFGVAVPYKELNRQSTANEADEVLRAAKSQISAALKKHKAPCEVAAKKGSGYVLQAIRPTHKRATK